MFQIRPIRFNNKSQLFIKACKKACFIDIHQVESYIQEMIVVYIFIFCGYVTTSASGKYVVCMFCGCGSQNVGIKCFTVRG